jgi:hypothetical protein
MRKSFLSIGYGNFELQNAQKTTAPRSSHVLSNHSTKEALSGLTAEIRRDPVFFGKYGRS